MNNKTKLDEALHQRCQQMLNTMLATSQEKSKWAGASGLDLLKAAKSGDTSAQHVILQKANRIIGAFFTGEPKEKYGRFNFYKKYKMYNSGYGPDFEYSALAEWVSICFEALVGGYKIAPNKNNTSNHVKLSALDALDLNKLNAAPGEELRAFFGKIYIQYLKNAIIEWQGFADAEKGYDSLDDMMYNSNPDTHAAKDRNTAKVEFDSVGSSGHDFTANEAEARNDAQFYAMADKEDFESWKQFCQDEDLQQEKKGLSWAKMVQEILRGLGVNDAARKLNTSPNNIRNNVKHALHIMTDIYGLDLHALDRLISAYGSEKLASYLG